MVYSDKYYCCYCETDNGVVICCNEISLKYNYACSIHESAVGENRSEYHQQMKIYVVDDVKRRLNLCEVTKGKYNKAKIAKELFDFLYNYPTFFLQHAKFLKTVYDKLAEFTYEDKEVMGDFVVLEYKHRLDVMVGNAIQSPLVGASPAEQYISEKKTITNKNIAPNNTI